jgi:hypothetical protein
MQRVRMEESKCRIAAGAEISNQRVFVCVLAVRRRSSLQPTATRPPKRSSREAPDPRSLRWCTSRLRTCRPNRCSNLQHPRTTDTRLRDLFRLDTTARPHLHSRQDSHPLSPEHRTLSPEHRTLSPEHRTRSPEQRTRSPEQRTRSPEHRTRSPEQRTRQDSPTPDGRHHLLTPGLRLATPGDFSIRLSVFGCLSQIVVWRPNEGMPPDSSRRRLPRDSSDTSGTSLAHGGPERHHR